MTGDARPTCDQCGAAQVENQRFCWLCGAGTADSENPYAAPSSAVAAQPEFTVWRAADNVIFWVLLAFVVLSAIGVATDGVPGLIGYLLLMAPGIWAFFHIRGKQQSQQRSGFFASRTYAMIASWFAAFAAMILLTIALIVLLFAICATQGFPH